MEYSVEAMQQYISSHNYLKFITGLIILCCRLLKHDMIKLLDAIMPIVKNYLSCRLL